MDDNKAIIDSLKKKVSRIIEDNRRLRSEVRELTAERDTVILEKRAAETEIRHYETVEKMGKNVTKIDKDAML